LAAKTAHLKEKLVKLESEMKRLMAMEKLMLASPDQQISLTDPDSRSMATSGRGSGVVPCQHRWPGEGSSRRRRARSRCRSGLLQR
jgi:hypothetical protein